MARYQSRYKKFWWSFKKKVIKFFTFIKKNIRIFLINILVFGIVIGWGVYIYKYFKNPNHDIKNLTITFDEIAGIYDQSDIKKNIEDRFLWTNKLSYKWKNIIWKDVSSKYNRIEKANMKLSWNTLLVDIKWKLPEFILIKDQLVYNIATNNTYLSTKDLEYYKQRPNHTSKIIYIKWVALTMTWLDGIFYNIGINSFTKQFEIITSTISWYNTLAYIPWGKKAEITMDNNQLLYFDLSKNMFEQVKKYQQAKEQYKNFYKYKIIDLGTIEDQVFLWN